jgi:hypothetical protein
MPNGKKCARKQFLQSQNIPCEKDILARLLMGQIQNKIYGKLVGMYFHYLKQFFLNINRHIYKKTAIFSRLFCMFSGHANQATTNIQVSEK